MQPNQKEEPQALEDGKERCAKRIKCKAQGQKTIMKNKL